ncbi:MAG TPA: AraC family transcriptional regulator [Tahibacter sp.]|uniref:AraC family transcriptional regulator n=1 Tax=Tahibacter sp. TaxID=2056211 RepID=UPI002C29706E|nr:AraC family transcriptional regulator [Tahibacter sp.]HSX62574.1 AraC family transcriptional regulator [Tahibacter sp.]
MSAATSTPSVAPFDGFAPQRELADRIARLTHGDGLHATAVEPLVLIRMSEPTQPIASVYEPSLCVVVQGRKQAILGDEVFVYDPLNYLVVSMTLPVVGQILTATPAQPYLCLRITLDLRVLGELVLQSPPSTPRPTDRALFLARTELPLLDALLRLLRLLDSPQEIDVIAPLILREISYRALCGDLGYRLRDLVVADSAGHRVGRAIDLIKSRYADALSVEELADAAHMSVSALHHRFKAATSLSPLQFQKSLRLHEARRLMLAEGFEAAAAAHRVGYESASQFSREYRRLFGAPPRREIVALRALGGAASD